jgi:ABC-type nitrate/sulfonate/bicarbonate transport system substrate-binding protein
VRNSTIQMMALTTGEVQLSHTGGAPTLNAVAAGHDLKVVATFGHGVYWDIVSKPEIKVPEDLRGKELGVSPTSAAPLGSARFWDWSTSVLILNVIASSYKVSVIKLCWCNP